MNPHGEPLNSLPCAEPFFLQAKQGERFCILHAPAPALPARGAILYVHPFAEELNKTRRMAALQSRAFAAAGYAVLQLDLYGCGDSSGDFSDARWQIWKEDLALASDWLAQKTGAAVSVWGLRLGALLALEFARDTQGALASVFFWQPAFNGKAHLGQFLRMRMASQMLAHESPGAGSGATSNQEISRGMTLEIGGYALAPELALALNELDGAALAPPSCPLHWLELVQAATGKLAPATAHMAEAWRSAGATVHLHPVRGVPFWATPEIAECHAMLAATAAACQP